MVASGSLKEGMQRCWGQLALLVIHAQGAPAFSEDQRTAATRIISRCRDFILPIFSFDQDFQAIGGSAVQSRGRAGVGMHLDRWPTPARDHPPPRGPSGQKSDVQPLTGVGVSRSVVVPSPRRPPLKPQQ